MTTRYEVRDGVAILTLDNPPVNGFTRCASPSPRHWTRPTPMLRSRPSSPALAKAFSGGADIPWRIRFTESRR